eukprot:1503967-Rhodomonas_salina.2
MLRMPTEQSLLNFAALPAWFPRKFQNRPLSLQTDAIRRSESLAPYSVPPTTSISVQHCTLRVLQYQCISITTPLQTSSDKWRLRFLLLRVTSTNVDTGTVPRATQFLGSLAQVLHVLLFSGGEQLKLSRKMPRDMENTRPARNSEEEVELQGRSRGQICASMC